MEISLPPELTEVFFSPPQEEINIEEITTKFKIDFGISLGLYGTNLIILIDFSYDTIV